MQSNRRAFTLIELLVVIAIIAVLMAILMPALQRIKKQARNVVCHSNLHQWGLIWAMYTQEHNGYFPKEVLSWRAGSSQLFCFAAFCLSRSFVECPLVFLAMAFPYTD